MARDIDTYCQRLLESVSIGKDPGPDDAALIIRTLPTLSYFQVEDVTANGREVFLVTPSKTIGAFVGRELATCGYKVTRFSNAWEALQLAASTKPDMVISAAVMEVIDGENFSEELAQILSVFENVGLRTALPA